MADNYSNLLNPELSISCPFILTLTLVVEDQVKTHSEANLKYMDLEKSRRPPMPNGFVRGERGGSGGNCVSVWARSVFHVSTSSTSQHSQDNNETALEVEQDILNSFRKNGLS